MNNKHVSDSWCYIFVHPVYSVASSGVSQNGYSLPYFTLTENIYFEKHSLFIIDHIVIEYNLRG